MTATRRPYIGATVWYRDFDDEVLKECDTAPKPTPAKVLDVRADNSVRLVLFFEKMPYVRGLPVWIPYSEEPRGNTWAWITQQDDDRPEDPYEVVKWAARVALLRAREAEASNGAEDAGAKVLREFAENLVFEWEEWAPRVLGPLPPLRVRRKPRV